MKYLVSAVAAAGALVGSAAAQEANIPNPRGIVANFDAANIAPVLREIGLTVEEKSDPNGRPFLRASVGEDFSFEVVPSACYVDNGARGCVGANFLARFTGSAPNQQTVAAYNQNYVFTTVGLLPRRTGAYVSRYEIADYGIPRGNLESSVSSFIYLATRFRDALATTSQTASADGYADDLSARLLNRRVGEAFGVVDANLDALARHRTGFEETVEIINALEATPSAPANKIRNLGARVD
ncbi:MAG: hypothetical protein ACFB00_11875 [Parvularculaceae bacterium]